MTEKPLSPTMKTARAYALKHNGILVRYPGGFWAKEGWTGEKPWFGTSTIEGLVMRGVASYTEYKQTLKSRFPVRVEVKP